jgi:hypothetical protein
MRMCDWCLEEIKGDSGFFLTHKTDRTIEVVIHNKCWDDFLVWLIPRIRSHNDPTIEITTSVPEDSSYFLNWEQNDDSL